MLRRLRIAATACFAALAVVFVVLWYSSYWKSLEAWAEYDWSASVRSSGGRVWLDYYPHSMMLCGTVTPPARGVRVDASDYDAPSDQSTYSELFLSEDVAQFASSVFVVDFHALKLIDDVYVVFPHRQAVLSCAALAAIPWISVRTRFSLRTMLLATTLIAALLGLFACRG